MFVCWADAAIGSASTNEDVNSQNTNDLAACICILRDDLKEPTSLSQAGCRELGSRIILVAENGENAFGIISIHQPSCVVKQEGTSGIRWVN
jgi:hypothetical protein